MLRRFVRLRPDAWARYTGILGRGRAIIWLIAFVAVPVTYVAANPEYALGREPVEAIAGLNLAAGAVFAAALWYNRVYFDELRAVLHPATLDSGEPTAWMSTPGLPGPDMDRYRRTNLRGQLIAVAIWLLGGLVILSIQFHYGMVQFRPEFTSSATAVAPLVVLYWILLMLTWSVIGFAAWSLFLFYLVAWNELRRRLLQTAPPPAPDLLGDARWREWEAEWRLKLEYHKTLREIFLKGFGATGLVLAALTAAWGYASYMENAFDPNLGLVIGVDLMLIIGYAMGPDWASQRYVQRMRKSIGDQALLLMSRATKSPRDRKRLMERAEWLTGRREETNLESANPHFLARTWTILGEILIVHLVPVFELFLLR